MTSWTSCISAFALAIMKSVLWSCFAIFGCYQESITETRAIKIAAVIISCGTVAFLLRLVSTDFYGFFFWLYNAFIIELAIPQHNWSSSFVILSLFSHQWAKKKIFFPLPSYNFHNSLRKRQTLFLSHKWKIMAHIKRLELSLSMQRFYKEVDFGCLMCCAVFVRHVLNV